MANPKLLTAEQRKITAPKIGDRVAHPGGVSVVPVPYDGSTRQQRRRMAGQFAKGPGGKRVGKRVP